MNPQIERQREMALSILKPSARDLERGLQLHSNSLVIESYSLGLNAPVDTEALNQATEAGASDPEYQDLVEGMIMTRWSETDALREEYREAWEASGVNCTFLNAGEEGNQPLQLIKRLARYVSLCDAMPDFLGRVSTARSIEDFHRANRRAICLTLNGVPLTGNLSSVPDEMRYIRVFGASGKA
jgi:membrane dipeptidase